MELYRHILVCADFSEKSGKAVETAKELARRDEARLSILHVVVPGLPLVPGGESPAERGRKVDLKEIAATVRTYVEGHYLAPDDPPRTEVLLRRGHPSVEILQYLEESDVDLVVMGSQGLSGMGLIILGSVTDRVVRKAPCSVLVVR